MRVLHGEDGGAQEGIEWVEDVEGFWGLYEGNDVDS